MALKITKESVIRGISWGIVTAGGMIIKDMVLGSNAPGWLKSAFEESDGDDYDLDSGKYYRGEMDYYTYCDRKEQRKFEMEKLEKQNKHEERLAEIRANAITIEPKQEETPNANVEST